MSETVSGILQCLQKGGGFLRDPAYSYQAAPDDPWVSSKLIRSFGLVDGASVTGKASRGKKGFQLTEIDLVCGLDPAQFQRRKRFEQLLPISPDERFRIGNSGKTSMRIVELISPLGKGTRGLVVSPPKSGKTQILEDIANAIYENEPDTRIIVLLIDERPEEVTHFRRNVKAEVLASSIDQTMDSHINLAELALAHIRCELECGRNIVVLVDSITRLARAFNLSGTGSRRTMSGGLDAKALEIPRKFFGLARNIEDGGSVTVIATALVDTGSRMDDFIFEEFKGTGNSEIVLDRDLANSRIFPAINILESSTRKEELLFTEDEIGWIHQLRRKLARMEAKSAMESMLGLMRKAPTNKKLIEMKELV